jgi:uncharacterized protein affecting Mg2+/Co2+ transport
MKDNFLILENIEAFLEDSENSKREEYRFFKTISLDGQIESDDELMNRFWTIRQE